MIGDVNKYSFFPLGYILTLYIVILDIYIMIPKYQTVRKYIKTDIIKNRPHENSFKKSNFFSIKNYLKTLSVNNRRTFLIIFLFCYPHVLETIQRAQNRSTDPSRNFTLFGSSYLNKHITRC